MGKPVVVLVSVQEDIVCLFREHGFVLQRQHWEAPEQKERRVEQTPMTKPVRQD